MTVIAPAAAATAAAATTTIATAFASAAAPRPPRRPPPPQPPPPQPLPPPLMVLLQEATEVENADIALLVKKKIKACVHKDMFGWVWGGSVMVGGGVVGLLGRMRVGG